MDTLTIFLVLILIVLLYCAFKLSGIHTELTAIYNRVDDLLDLVKPAEASPYE